MVLNQDFLDRGLLLTRKLLNQDFLLVRLKSSHSWCFTVAIMTWLTVTEYLCHKWPRICSTCRKHFFALSSFMTYRRVCDWWNTTGAISGARTAYPSGEPEFISGIRLGHFARSFVFCVVFYGSLFVLLSFFIWPLCCLSFKLRIPITPFSTFKFLSINLGDTP